MAGIAVAAIFMSCRGNELLLCRAERPSQAGLTRAPRKIARPIPSRIIAVLIFSIDSALDPVGAVTLSPEDVEAMSS